MGVFLYVPNLIGYARVALAMYSMVISLTEPKLFVVLYALSQGLDAVDGTVARALGQSSKFGAVLDMLTDRCSTMGLIIVLSQLYRDQWLVFAFLVALDIWAHWSQMYATLLLGGASHKTAVQNPFLRLYYSFPFLLIFCVGNEAYFLCKYVDFFLSESNEWKAALGTAQMVLLPLCACKQFFNVLQLVESSQKIAAIDESEKAKKK